MNKHSEAKYFKQLDSNDKDLTMFSMTDLELVKNEKQVHMVISFKRKIQMELLTTYLPTLLLLVINGVILANLGVPKMALWVPKSKF